MGAQRWWQVWKNEPYTFSSDMWALGCVLYELAALSIPFRGQTLFDLRAKVGWLVRLIPTGEAINCA